MPETIAEHKRRPDPVRMGQLLRTLRISALMTQQQTADALRVPKSTYSNWERGAYLPAVHNVQALKALYPKQAEQLQKTYMGCKIKSVRIMEE